ncbi:MAG: hypothetical protein ABI164_04235 [Acidobacteriaceae bacterium]
MRSFRSSLLLALVLALVGAAASPAQSTWQPGHPGIGFTPPKSNQWVQLVSSPRIAMKASARPQPVALKFVIQTGLHINSHSPHSPFLIPTSLTFDSVPDVHIANVQYPAGVDYHFRFSPQEALSVYTGEFSLLVPLRARAGKYMLHGQLRYQACDDRSCNPPKTLPVTVEVTAQ